MSAAAPAGAILFDSVEAVRANTIEFDDWHGNDHLADLTQQLPGAALRQRAAGVHDVDLRARA